MTTSNLFLSLLAGILISTSGLAAPAPQAAPASVNHVQAGYYLTQIGDFDVTALSDGTLPLPAADLLTNAKPGEVASLLAAAYQSTSVHTSVNAYLIKTGDDRLILVDAGTGQLFGPSLDKLTASLKRAGYEPEQINDILITHIHTDHVGGLMDGKRMVFPNAVLHVEKKEATFWLSPENRAKAPDDSKKYFDQAIEKVQPYVDAGKVKTFDGATELFPGIRAIPSPGHTPGHSFYAIESKGEKLVFWGDVVHVAAVQMPDPAVTIAFDMDPKTAAVTRKKAFDDAAAGRYWVAGDHLSFPGIGHLQKDAKAYRWVPIPYVNDYYAEKGAK